MQLQQAADDADVPDVGNVAQAARAAAEQGGHHGLGHEVLRTSDTDLALERGAAMDKQDVVGHGSRVPGVGQGPKAGWACLVGAGPRFEGAAAPLMEW
ncbi:hypothetical protein GCM10010406_00310 [Streptomyces thermolineatus]|uniref:Uncharacterized protein n=1 Tax=Streptomyces thermolineatus TaxID=44033 RepID=A0ABN3KPJ3_9ACTN